METAKLISAVVRERGSSVCWVMETGPSAVYSSGTHSSVMLVDGIKHFTAPPSCLLTSTEMSRPTRRSSDLPGLIVHCQTEPALGQHFKRRLIFLMLNLGAA